MQRIGDALASLTEGLFVATKREVHVARGCEPRLEQVFYRVEQYHHRSLVVERPTTIDESFGDAALERWVTPGIALVDRYDVVVRHQHRRGGGVRRSLPTKEQAEVGNAFTLEAFVHERVELFEQLHKCFEGRIAANIELSRNRRQLNHLRQPRGDVWARRCVRSHAQDRSDVRAEQLHRRAKRYRGCLASQLLRSRTAPSLGATQEAALQTNRRLRVARCAATE